MPAGKITALQAQAHDPQRVNVFIDGAFALGVSLTTITRERLYVGQALNSEEYERLVRAEQSDRAYQAALRILESRPRSAHEIRDRLQRKGFEPDLIDYALERLTDLGLINDAVFARYWIENRQLARPRGPAALRDELRRKGIDRDLISETLQDEELIGDPDQQALVLARSVVRKYANAADYAAFSRRLGGFLQRRGFHQGTIRPIVAQLWRELGQTSSEESD
ncbi:MAG: RecX family transcriptional regulator [Roseiflexaceae bacterium]